MSLRRHERFELCQPASWDYYSEADGARSGVMANLSESGCLLKTDEVIENRRWIRILLRQTGSNVSFALVGRVVRRENALECLDHQRITLFRYGVEFVRPERIGFADLDLILALSARPLATVVPLRPKPHLHEPVPGLA